jgi:predicted CXXCH cytochrome family protein
VALHGPAYRPGQDLEDTMRLMRPRQIASQPFLQDQLKATPDYIRERYWPDGIVRISGRDYSGLVESACFRSGMLSCLSCHSMHDSDPQNQLKPQMMGNEACLQCHTSYRDAVEEHTHHPAGSEGSTCYNCHMPRTVYGLMKSIRSHYIDSPNAAVAGAGARPNACNLCHLDKTLGWTASHLSEWYGSPTPVLSADDESTASSLLQLLRGDAGQRALVASHMGWAPAREASGSTWFAPFLAQLLNDEYSAVRYIAGRSLRELPGFEDVDYDYLGSRAARDEARRRVLDSWRATQVGPRRVVGRELLIDSSGGLMVDAIAPLIGERDPRPLYLAE